MRKSFVYSAWVLAFCAVPVFAGPFGVFRGRFQSGDGCGAGGCSTITQPIETSVVVRRTVNPSSPSHDVCPPAVTVTVERPDFNMCPDPVPDQYASALSECPSHTLISVARSGAVRVGGAAGRGVVTVGAGIKNGAVTIAVAIKNREHKPLRTFWSNRKAARQSRRGC